MPPPFAIVCWNVDFTSPPQVRPDREAAAHIADSIETLLGEDRTPVLLFLLECNAGHFRSGQYAVLDQALGARGFANLVAVDVSTKECILITTRGLTLVTTLSWNGWRTHYQQFETEANEILSTAFPVRTTRSGSTSGPTVLPHNDLRDAALATIQLRDNSVLSVGAMHAAAPGRGTRPSDSGGSGVPITEQHVSAMLRSLLGVADILVGDFNLAPNRTHVTRIGSTTTIQATGFHSFNAFYTEETTTTGGSRYDHAYMAPGYVGVIRVLEDRRQAIRSVHDPIALRDIAWGPVQVPLPSVSTWIPQLALNASRLALDAPGPSTSMDLVPVHPTVPRLQAPTPTFNFTSLFSPLEEGTGFGFSSLPTSFRVGTFGPSSYRNTLGPSVSLSFGRGNQKARRESTVMRARLELSQTSFSVQPAVPSISERMLALRRTAVSHARQIRLGELVQSLGAGPRQGSVVGRLRRMRLLIRSRTESGYRLLRAERLQDPDRNQAPFTGDIFRSFHITMGPLLMPLGQHSRLEEETVTPQMLFPDTEVAAVSWEDEDGDRDSQLLTPGPTRFLL